jgi:hypothetical protein
MPFAQDPAPSLLFSGSMGNSHESPSSSGELGMLGKLSLEDSCFMYFNFDKFDSDHCARNDEEQESFSAST